MPITLAARIKARRQAARLSLEALAAAAGLSKTYLWELEADREGRKRPSADVLARLAVALGTTLSDLAGLPGERTLADLRTVALIQDQLCWLARSPAVRNAEITTVVKILMRWQDRLKGERPALPTTLAPEACEACEESPRAVE